MTNNRTVKDERRFASVASTERLLGREADVVGNLSFFCVICQIDSISRFLTLSISLSNNQINNRIKWEFIFQDYFPTKKPVKRRRRRATRKARDDDDEDDDDIDIKTELAELGVTKNGK